MSRFGLVVFVVVASILTALAVRTLTTDASRWRYVPVRAVIAWILLIVFLDFIRPFFERSRE